MRTRTSLLLLLANLSPCWANAQQTQPADAPAAPFRGFPLGPFLFRPTFRLGTIGLDTNVFYTPTERQTDFTGSGGPGLEVALPIRSVELAGFGNVDYLYFLRTESLRRLTGGGGGRVRWNASRFHIGVERSYAASFSRPALEVDRRLFIGQWQTHIDLGLQGPATTGRFGLDSSLRADRIKVDPNQTFLGADPASLNRDVYSVSLGLRYALTPKTAVISLTDYQLDRFLENNQRDADSNRIGLGLQLTSATRLSGRFLAGIRSFRPRLAGIKRFWPPFAQGDFMYRFGPRTRLLGAYNRDLDYTVFTVDGPTQTARTEVSSLRLEKDLIGGLSIIFLGNYRRFRTEGRVTVVRVDGSSETAVRDDKTYEGGADLGYRFRFKLRIGATAIYSKRRSTFADFGIQGLLVGATITYQP